MQGKSRFVFRVTAFAALLAVGVAVPSAEATNNVISGSTNRTCAASSALETNYLLDTWIFARDCSLPEYLELFDSRFCTWDDFGLLKFSSFPPTGFGIFIR